MIDISFPCTGLSALILNHRKAGVGNCVYPNTRNLSGRMSIFNFPLLQMVTPCLLCCHTVRSPGKQHSYNNHNHFLMISRHDEFPLLSHLILRTVCPPENGCRVAKCLFVCKSSFRIQEYLFVCGFTGWLTGWLFALLGFESWDK